MSSVNYDLLLALCGSIHDFRVNFGSVIFCLSLHVDDAYIGCMCVVPGAGASVGRPLRR